MDSKDFFLEQAEQSRIKTQIVTTYFRQWARIMKGVIKGSGASTGTIAYIDLFAGPGRYEDGNPSTPLLVLTEATKDPEIADKLITIFNEKDCMLFSKLETNIFKMPLIESLRHKPIILNLEVGRDIARVLGELRLPPTLMFVDPWGYKGLTLQLIDNVVRQWGCDCIIFFNYNRINPGVDNPLVREHMSQLFGEARLTALRKQLAGSPSTEREAIIVEGMYQALQCNGTRYVLPFCFKTAQGGRTSHHLFFVSKNFKAYEIMKCVMSCQSSSHEQGVASLTYCPTTASQGLLFELNRPLDDLGEMLLTTYSGQILTMKQIHEDHSVGRPYTSAHYKMVLTHLEEAGLITADPPATKRIKRKGQATFPDNVKVRFPPKEV